MDPFNAQQMALYTHVHVGISSGLMGTNNHGILLFAWVLLFRKLVVTMLMGTNIYGILVIGGYLYSRVYDMPLWSLLA